MKNSKKIIKALIMSLITLCVGFLALSLPFKLFNDLSRRDMQIMFVLELAIYFICGIVFLSFKGKKETERVKEEQRRFQRRLKFEQAQREYYDLAA